ncbi:MAG: hypothetical protein IT289_05530 [Oligoflexia bacterium]|nr:hypothetical protein [Oligoflexia bacterium]
MIPIIYGGEIWCGRQECYARFPLARPSAANSLHPGRIVEPAFLIPVPTQTTNNYLKRTKWPQMRGDEDVTTQVYTNVLRGGTTRRQSR